MVNNEILTFVKEQLSQGKTKEDIRDMLVTHGGWDDKDVEEAFDASQISGVSMPHMMEQNKPAVAGSPSSNMSATHSAFQARVAPKTMEPSRLSEMPAEEPIIKPVVQRPPVQPAPIAGEMLSNLREQFAGESAAPAIAAVPSQSPEPVVAFNPTVQPPAFQAFPSPQTPKQPASPVAPAPAPFVMPQQVAPVSEVVPPAREEVKTMTPTPGISFSRQPQPLRPTAPQPSPIQFLNQMPAAVTPQAESRPFPISVNKNNPQGRKLLGFVMLLMGMLLGAVAMHAYLNGYLDPIITQVTKMLGK